MLAPSRSVVTADAAQSPLFRQHRVRPLELLFWGAAVAVLFVFPDDLAFATAVVTMALFALSLDIILGFAGVLSLCHAVFFGVGAYAAGLIALSGHQEPITGAILAGLVAAAAAAVTGPLVLRFTGLPLMMVTLAIGGIFYEAANKASWLTGGDNGLFGFEVSPLFGIFRWSVYSTTAYCYALGWLFVLFLLLKLIVSSSFGIALRGIRENARRMRLIGSPVLSHLLIAYTISAFVAGTAGAISAQTTKFVGLQVISLESTIDVLVMLVLGGVARLYGGLVGAPIYMIIHHIAAQWNPYHWPFVIGALLILVVKFGRGGILGFADKLLRMITKRDTPP